LIDIMFYKDNIIYERSFEIYCKVLVNNKNLSYTSTYKG